MNDDSHLVVLPAHTGEDLISLRELASIEFTPDDRFTYRAGSLAFAGDVRVGVAAQAHIMVKIHVRDVGWITAFDRAGDLVAIRDDAPTHACAPGDLDTFLTAVLCVADRYLTPERRAGLLVDYAQARYEDAREKEARALAALRNATDAVERAVRESHEALIALTAAQQPVSAAQR